MTPRSALAVAVLFGAAGVIAAAGLGCSATPSERPALGALPSASTSAEPEWLPRRVMAGRAAEVDPRERHLFDLRRVTEGWDVQAVAWDRALWIVASEAGDQPALYRVGAGFGAKPERVSAPGEAVRLVAAGGGRVVVVVGSELVEIDAAGARRVLGPASGVVALALSRDGKGLFTLVARGAVPSRGPAKPADPGDRELVRAPEGVRLFAGRLSALAGPPIDGSPWLIAQAGTCAAPPCPDAPLRLARLSDEGRGATAIAELPEGARIAGASQHPSGRVAAVASDLDRKAGELYLAPLEPGARPSRDALDRVTYQQAESPAFSPDGRSLAFVSVRLGGTRDLFVARFVEDP